MIKDPKKPRAIQPPQSGRRPISFPLDWYNEIRAAAENDGFHVGAGNGSQLSLYVWLRVTGNPMPKKETKQDES